ncbi:hypothetical protein CPB86DRAFT_790034 [Serendipita vermifera]|nr:hypothetical protein CPB86DRAFT_790034 [Serendipita vermifera]
MSSRQERESAFRRTAPENRVLGGLAPVNEHSATPLNGSSGINTPAGIESYDLGAPYDEHANAAPIPEGMSQDLGAGEYDVDREKEWKSFGSAGDAARGHTAGDHLRVERDAPGADSSTPSNFLDFKDSKSGMSGTSGELSSPSPHPYPPPPLPKVEQHHAHPSSHSSHPPIHAYGVSEDGLGARRGSDTSNKNANASRPSSAKSRGGSSAQPRSMGEGQKRIDLSDYSIPMKFNPTPARPQPAVSPFEDDDDVPYKKSKNGSSRSLSKFFSKSSEAPPLPVSSKDDTSTPSSKSGAWNSLTAIFSNKYSTSNLSLPNQASDLGENPGCDYPPSNPHIGARGLPVTGAVHWHEKPTSDYYTGDMGPRKRQSSSVTRSDYDIPKKVGVDNLTHIVAFGRRPSDTPSHAASQDRARSNSDTWSRAGGRAYYLHADEEPYGRRPSTGRSSHSYSSSTFGTQSGKNYAATSDTSLRGPVELVNPFAGGEMKEKERSNEVLYNIRHPSYEIGRAI